MTDNQAISKTVPEKKYKTTKKSSSIDKIKLSSRRRKSKPAKNNQNSARRHTKSGGGAHSAREHRSRRIIHSSSSNESVGQLSNPATNRPLAPAPSKSQQQHSASQLQHSHRRIKSPRAFQAATPKRLIFSPQKTVEEENLVIMEMIQKRKNTATKELKPVDSKTQLILDRVKKNKEMIRSLHQQPTKPEKPANFLSEEKISRESALAPGKSNNSSEIYENVPKWEDIEKMSDENIFDESGNPTWMSVLEPSESDTKSIEPAISVGSDHIEMYYDKKFVLKFPANQHVILDQWQRIKSLKKQDRLYFTPELVFSNTIRSLINVAGKAKKNPITESKSSETACREKKADAEMITQDETPTLSVTFLPQKTMDFYVYLRSKPIKTSRQRVVTTKDQLDAKTYSPFVL